MPCKNPTRRKALLAGASVSAFTIVPASVLAQASKKKNASRNGGQLPPSERLNIGFVGIGGKGGSNINGCAHHNVYALCDVDTARGAGAFSRFPAAKRFDDWRVMLDKEANNLDAVVVSTPDHNHAVVSMAAMKLGLGVYCEKPLTRTISEARILTEYARKNRVICQMGNQGHANDHARMAVEWIQAGLLGDVREVHCWTNRPVWPQGIVRPAAEAVPATMNWDVWLGPAPKAGYSSQIAPFKWRAYWDYGAGALGDMAAHIIDHPVWALGLGAPQSVKVDFERADPASARDTFPASTVVTFEFAARGEQPPVQLKWYDGKSKMPWPQGLETSRQLNKTGGIAYFGSTCNLLQGCYGKSPRIFPEAKMQEAVKGGLLPPKTIPRSPGHYEEWLQAVKNNDYYGPKSNFDYAGPLTETMLLGCVAMRVGPGTKLNWDSKNMTTDNELANRYIQHEYRTGWSL